MDLDSGGGEPPQTNPATDEKRSHRESRRPDRYSPEGKRRQTLCSQTPSKQAQHSQQQPRKKSESGRNQLQDKVKSNTASQGQQTEQQTEAGQSAAVPPTAPPETSTSSSYSSSHSCDSQPAPVLLPSASSSSPQNARHFLPSPPTQPRMPSLHDICCAQWPTLLHVPADVRDEWSAVFTTALEAFLAAPSGTTLTSLFLCSKALLASVRHGGKARIEAVNRTLRARFTLWRAGRFAELWERVTTDHAHRTMTQQKHDEDQLLREARRVASLVDQGMLSRAASQLCSRGIPTR